MDEKLLSRSESLEEEARQLRLSTDKKITRATTEFRILGGLMAVALLALAVFGFFLFNQSRANEEAAHGAQAAAVSAEAAVAGIAENQKDLDSLVAFVEHLKDREGQDDGPNSETAAVFKVVHEMRTLICASQDPARQAACQQLGG